MGFPKIRGALFGGPHNKDYSILGSILGSPYFGKLPYGHSIPNCEDRMERTWKLPWVWGFSSRSWVEGLGMKSGSRYIKYIPHLFKRSVGYGSLHLGLRSNGRLGLAGCSIA